MFAVIETGGKQYKVAGGQKVKIEKIEGEVGAVVSFDKVLLIADGEQVNIGTPYLEGAKVDTKITRQARARKVIILKYKNKTRQARKKGHRQHFTEVEITSVK